MPRPIELLGGNLFHLAFPSGVLYEARQMGVSHGVATTGAIAYQELPEVIVSLLGTNPARRGCLHCFETIKSDVACGGCLFAFVIGVEHSVPDAHVSGLGTIA